MRIVLVVEHMRMIGECIMHGSVEWLFKGSTTVQYIETSQNTCNYILKITKSISSAYTPYTSSLFGGLAPSSQGTYFQKDMEIDLHYVSDASPLYPTGTEVHHTRAGTQITWYQSRHWSQDPHP